MRITILALVTSAAFVIGCGGSVNASPADADSGVVTEVDDAGAVDSGPADVDAAPAGDPCTLASECPTFDCPKCGVIAAFCKGSHVCATEEETCAAITCDSPDAD